MPLRPLESGLTTMELFRIMENTSLTKMYCECVSLLDNATDDMREEYPHNFHEVYDDLYNVTLEELKRMIKKIY